MQLLFFALFYITLFYFYFWNLKGGGVATPLTSPPPLDPPDWLSINEYVYIEIFDFQIYDMQQLFFFQNSMLEFLHLGSWRNACKQPRISHLTWLVWNINVCLKTLLSMSIADFFGFSIKSYIQLITISFSMYVK